jgi:hypothetical protein
MEDRYLSKKVNKLVPLVGVVAAGVLIAIAVAATPTARTRSKSENEETVRLALSLPPGVVARSVGYVVKSSSNEGLASGSIVVADPTASASLEVRLPPGTGNTVTFISDPGSSESHGQRYLGSETFDVVAGSANHVDVGANRFAPFQAGTGASSEGSSSVGATVAGASGATNCQTCELGSEQGRCDPELLTATGNSDPNGNVTPSWGCDTLSTAPQKAACAALLHCISTTQCGAGDSPVAGCYCGSASAVPCFSGEGIDGPCIPFYRAAAVVSADGPGATANDAELSRFVATFASNPKTPIGLADNVGECALVAHCDACNSQ